MTENNDERAERAPQGGDSARPAWKKSSAERQNNSSDRQERSESERPRRDSSDRPRRESGDRPRRDGDRRFGDKPRGERPGRAGDGRNDRERPEWQTRVDRVRDPNRAKSPMIPEEITEKDLDLLVRVQFKTLSPENSERVARHLAMVNLLINDDPELAHQHAIAAADRAGRIAVVRETLALTAYTVGDFALALREMQAYRRISGANDQLPIMVDCERGLGRPDKALELGRSVDPKSLEPGVRANLAIAMSGARLDRGENELALAELEIAELNPEKVFDYSPQLFRAYSDTLEILGRAAESKRWANLAERADAALAAKNAPAFEMQDIIEEIEIPAPYESRRADEGESRGFRGAPRDFGDRPRRDFGDRPRRDSDRPVRDGDSPRRDFSERPRRDGNRPARDGDRPSRPFSDRPRRDDGDRPRRDFGSRNERPSRPAGDQPQLDFGDRKRAPRDGDRPRNDRPRDGRPGSDRPRRDSSDRPRGERPRGDRPGGNRAGGRPSSERPDWKKKRGE